MCKSSVHNYLKKNLGLKAYKRKRQPLLTEKQRKNRLRFAKKYQDLPEKNGKTMCLVTNHQCICFMNKIEKMTLFGEARKIKFLLPKKFKKSAHVNIWGWGNVSKWTFSNPYYTQRQTVDAEYYVEDILEKEVQPL